MNTVALEKFAVSAGGSVDPSKYPAEEFDLYSIPAYDKYEPEVAQGSEIGSTKKTVQPGDVLLSRIVPHIRRVWVVGPSHGRRQIGSGEWIIFRGDSFDSNYLRHMLMADPFHKQFMQTVAGVGGSLLRARPSEVEKIKIPLPSLSEQKRIAAILDKADAIRRKRQQAVKLTEELLRSVFLDMFGDPVTNPKGWDTGNIDAVLRNPKADLRCGPFGTQLKVHELVNEGIPLFGIESVRNGKFQNKTSKFLTTRKAAELGSFDTKPGDVLVTRMGTIGEACVVPEGTEDARISYHLFRIRPDRSKCLPEFLAATIFQSGTFLMQLKNMAHGAIMDGLSTSNLRDVVLLIPPITEQIKYVNVVKKSEKLMESQKETTNAADTLFTSLLQRAFRGELS